MESIISKMQWGLVVIVALFNLSACGGGSDNGGNNAGANQDDLVV